MMTVDKIKNIRGIKHEAVNFVGNHQRTGNDGFARKLPSSKSSRLGRVHRYHVCRKRFADDDV